MDFDSLVDDSQKAAAPAAPALSFDELPDHAPTQSFDSMVDDNAKFGTGPQQALAGVEGVARGLTFGGSDVALPLLGDNPKEMLARRDANPWTAGISTAVGGAGVAALTGGIAAPLEGALLPEGAGLLAKAGTAAAAWGTEGALYGAGNAVSDAALGDPTLNGEKIVAHIGLGAALGAGLGVLTRPFRSVESGLASGAAKAFEDIPPPDAVPTPESPLVAEVSPPKEPPKDFVDLQERIAHAQSKGETIALPQQAVLDEATSRLPDLDNPVLPQQRDQLGSRAEQFAYGVLRDSDSEVGEALQNWEAIQKAELNAKTDQAVEALAPNVEPLTSDVAGGNRAIDLFTKTYEAAKKAMAPMFEALDKINLGDISGEIQPLMERFAEKIPGVAQMFKYNEAGEIEGVLPHNSAWGITEDAYNAVKKVFKDMAAFKEEPASIRTLLNFRKSMGEKINLLTNEEAAGQVRGLMGSFMDHIQSIADDHVEDLGIRDLFKRYAINEQDREIIEKVFKASVGGHEFGGISKVKPQAVLDKIFAEPRTVDAAKRILSPKDFRELLMHHMAAHKEFLTTNGVFSSRRFATLLKNQAPGLEAAFSDFPHVLQRLRDLTTVSTIIPDASSVNPSGSAKTAIKMMKNLMEGLSVHDLTIGLLSPKALAAKIGTQAAKAVMDSVSATRANNAAIQQFNHGLAGKSAQQITIQATGKMLSIIDSNLDRAARAIFSHREEAK